MIENKTTEKKKEVYITYIKSNQKHINLKTVKISRNADLYKLTILIMCQM